MIEPGAISSNGISIVVVAHNSEDQLDACVATLAADDHNDVEVIVVDSGSFAAPLVAPGVRLLTLPNLGYGTAINEASKVAAGGWMVFMNPDVRVSVRELVTMRDIARAHSLSMIAPSLRDSRGTPARHFDKLPRPPWRQEWWSEPEGSAGDYTPEMSIQGSVVLVRLSVFRDLNGFDSRYFLYFEEIDLARRFWEAGHLVASTERASAMHIGEGSSDVPGAFRLAERARGKFNYLLKFYSRPEASMALILDVLLATRRYGLRTGLAVVRQLRRNPRPDLHIPTLAAVL